MPRDGNFFVNIDGNNIDKLKKHQYQELYIYSKLYFWKFNKGAGQPFSVGARNCMWGPWLQLLLYFFVFIINFQTSGQRCVSRRKKY
jgi:hypothetical protein